MIDRSPQIEALANAPDGPERTSLLRRFLVDCAGPPTRTAELQQLGAVLGDHWPATALRALRGVVPPERPQVLVALAPWLDASLAREALDLIALFEAPMDIERAFRVLAPKLVDAPIVALLKVLRHINEPALQARLLCVVAAHAEASARTSLLAAATRVARRTASEPERLEATVAVARLGGAEAALAAWETVVQLRHRNLRAPLLAALAPAIAGERLPGLLVHLDAPEHELEAILEPALGELRGDVLLDTLAQLEPRFDPGSPVVPRLLVSAMHRMRGLDLLVVVEHAMRRFDNFAPRDRDELLGRAVASLSDAELAAAEPRLRSYGR